MYTYLVLTTVTGINRAPDMERAVAPKHILCKGVKVPSVLNWVFNQLREEK